MQQAILKATHFNVSEKLKSRTLMGEIRGLEMKDQIAALLDDLNPNDAIVVDATDALIFDYDFSGYAFAPFFEDAVGGPLARHLIFRIAGPDRPAFFRGILKRLKKPLGTYAQSQESFADAGLFCKLTECDRRTIEYVGQVTHVDRRILAAIDASRTSNADELHASMHLPTEEVVDSLRRLVNHGFLLDIGDAEHRYHSFCAFLAQIA